MKRYFEFKNISCSLCNGPVLSLPPATSTQFETNLVFRADLTWNSLSEFQLRIKILRNVDCNYSRCNSYCCRFLRKTEIYRIYQQFIMLLPYSKCFIS